MAIVEGAWHKTILLTGSTLEDAIRCLNDSSMKIALVVDTQGVLQGTISDGDIRRGLLRGLDLKSDITSVTNRNALVVPPEFGRDTVTQLMQSNQIQQIPVVDEDQRVVGLHLWSDTTPVPQRENIMIIMAGGKGARLLPQTEKLPKPMMLVAGKPILQHILERGQLEGFSRFVLAIHYLGDVIEDYFEDGSRFGVSIQYLKEQSSLGTVGALSLLDQRPERPFIVTNGDVIADIRYGELLDFHILHQATATMAVRLHEWQHPFGVVHTSGLEIVGFEEKPVVRANINAGVYVLSPDALEALTRNEYCDMPTLFERIQTKNMRTVAYPTHESWLDVGKPEDLQRARAEGERLNRG